MAEQKNDQQADEALVLACKLLPENAAVHYNYGLLLKNQSKFNKAESVLLKAYQLDLQSTETVYALVDLHMKLKSKTHD